MMVLKLFTFTFLFAIVGFAVPAVSQPAFDEVRIGLMRHDAESNSNEDGTDLNLEILFPSTEWLGKLRSPRPLIGTSLNSDNETHQIYGGLAWDFDMSESIFGEVMIGTALHDGKSSGDANFKGKEYGCAVLFRESLSLGYRLDEDKSIMASVSHISNGGLCDENSGLTNAGFRFTFRY
jgi:hypothetical protein